MRGHVRGGGRAAAGGSWQRRRGPLALGCPLVATAVGGMREVHGKGLCGGSGSVQHILEAAGVQDAL